MEFIIKAIGNAKHLLRFHHVRCGYLNRLLKICENECNLDGCYKPFRFDLFYIYIRFLMQLLNSSIYLQLRWIKHPRRYQKKYLAL